MTLSHAEETLRQLADIDGAPSDYTSECDSCHTFNVPLWIDDSDAGEFAFCEPCWQRFARRAKRVVAMHTR